MHPVRNALTQPVLLVGMERFPLVLVLFVAGVFVLVLKPAAIISGLIISGAGVIVLRRTAEQDSQYFAVLYSRLKYGRYHGSVPLDAGERDYRFWQR